MSAPLCPCCGFDLAPDNTVKRNGFYMEPYEDPIIQGMKVHFTASELAVLWAIVKADGKVVSKEVLLDRCGTDANYKIIDVWVCKLRKKLATAFGGFECIETVWGRGYRWNWPNEMALAA